LVFFQNLTSQLAEIIPIPNNRIKTDGNYQIDSTALNQILIPMKILESNNPAEINVLTIADTLNTLIRNKEITLISRNNLTSMLDETYGLKEYSKYILFKSKCCSDCRCSICLNLLKYIFISIFRNSY
jgi:hypothetical protein